VPLPVAQNRHAVVMSLISGPNLNRCILEKPREILDEILENVRTAYGMGVIHADLSEFIVMVEDGRCVIIDWPQWVGTDHVNARHLLSRDIEKILTFFKKKYKITCSLEDSLRCVTG
jgi:RIO kinase 2